MEAKWIFFTPLHHAICMLYTKQTRHIQPSQMTSFHMRVMLIHSGQDILQVVQLLKVLSAALTISCRWVVWHGLKKKIINNYFWFTLNALIKIILAKSLANWPETSVYMWENLCTFMLEHLFCHNETLHLAYMNLYTYSCTRGCRQRDLP